MALETFDGAAGTLPSPPWTDHGVGTAWRRNGSGVATPSATEQSCLTSYVGASLGDPLVLEYAAASGGYVGVACFIEGSGGSANWYTVEIALGDGSIVLNLFQGGSFVDTLNSWLIPAGANQAIGDKLEVTCSLDGGRPRFAVRYWDASAGSPAWATVATYTDNSTSSPPIGSGFGMFAFAESAVAMVESWDDGNSGGGEESIEGTSPGASEDTGSVHLRVRISGTSPGASLDGADPSTVRVRIAGISHGASADSITDTILNIVGTADSPGASEDSAAVRVRVRIAGTSPGSSLDAAGAPVFRAGLAGVSLGGSNDSGGASARVQIAGSSPGGSNDHAYLGDVERVDMAGVSGGSSEDTGSVLLRVRIAGVSAGGSLDRITIDADVSIVSLTGTLTVRPALTGALTVRPALTGHLHIEPQ